MPHGNTSSFAWAIRIAPPRMAEMKVDLISREFRPKAFGIFSPSKELTGQQIKQNRYH
jgi:hypothetical protein